MLENRARRCVASALVTLTLGLPAGAFAAEKPADQPPVIAPAPAPAPGKEQVVLATLKVSREEAIATAKRFFPIPDDLGQPNVNVNQGREGATWSLNWQTPPKQSERVMINVSVDGMTGEVRSYERSAQSAGEPGPLKYTRAEAFKFAETWLERLAGAHKADLRLDDRAGQYGFGGNNASYAFRWERMEQGYPVADESVNMTIDARTGELSNFYMQWRPDQSFKLPGSLLDRAKAEAAVQAYLPLTLMYQHFQQPGTDKGEWRLVYRTINGPGYPNISQDGKMLGPDGTPVTALSSEPRRVPPAPKPYQAPVRPLSREQALALAQAVTGRTEPPTGANYSESGQETKTSTWQFSWTVPGQPDPARSDAGKSEPENFNVQVNLEKGVIANYYSYTSRWDPLQEQEEPKTTPDEARATAIAFIQTHRPDLAGNLLMMPSGEIMPPRPGIGRNPFVHISFLVTKNGIPVADRNASIEIDLRTGKVRSFWGNDLSSEVEPFPAVEGMITPADAQKARAEHQPLSLAWVSFWMTPQAKGDMARTEPQLVWTFSRSLNVNAFDGKTGAPLDYNGRDLVEAARRPTDIEGHFAQREIELLWGRGVFELKGGKFNPQGRATAGEIARWLVLAKGMQPYMGYDFRGAFGGKGGGDAMAARVESSAEAPYFGAALQAGILLPEDFDLTGGPDAQVSRELAALWAVRAMGYSAIAAMPNRIEMHFSDQAAIGARYANAVAILEGLGVVKGDGRSFDPQRIMSRGEAAKILFSVSSQGRSAPVFWK